MILQFLGRNLKDPGIYPMFAGWSRFPISASIAIFAFEGITVVSQILCLIALNIELKLIFKHFMFCF